MKKTMIVLGVVLCATLLVNPALACDGKEAKNASNDGATCSKTAAAQARGGCSKLRGSNEGATCSKSAAKAAYAKALEESGCEKTAQTAYKNTLAENVYAKSYAETSCSKTAREGRLRRRLRRDQLREVFAGSRHPRCGQGFLRRDLRQDRLREDRSGGLCEHHQDCRRQLRNCGRQGRLRQGQCREFGPTRSPTPT